MQRSYFFAGALLAAAPLITPLSLNAAPEDVQINEVYGNTLGADNSSESEHFELHNKSDSPIDISGYTIDIAGANNLTFVNPPGTIIPANGYLVYVTHKKLFLLDFPGFDESLIVDLAWPTPNSLLANGNASNTITITAQGATEPYETVTFLGLGEIARTQELTDPSLPNDVADNWQQSITERGTPGRRNSHYNPANITISNVERTVQFPTSTTPIIINAEVSGNDINAVNLYYTTSAGSNYTSVAMTLSSGSTYSADLGTFADGTILKYYVEVLAAAGDAHYPPFAAPVAFHISDNPITSDDLVINEILPDPPGTDNIDSSEYIEIYNRRATPVDMSFFKIGYTLGTTPNGRVLPEGVVIPANGYLVFAYNFPQIMAQYPSLGENNIPVIDGCYRFGGLIGNSHHAFLTHANVIFWNGLNWRMPGDPVLDSVNFTSEWPHSENFSMELKHPVLDNSLMENWAQTTVAGGTPGAQNSVFESGVNDWSIY